MNQQIPSAIAKIAPEGKLTSRQRRRLLIDMALRRIRPGTGSSHEFMKRRTAMHQWPDLRKVLEGYDWVIVGGVATRAYMPERFTKDMDILVREEDGRDVLDRLQKAGFVVESPLSIGGYLLSSPEGVEIDLIFGNQAWLAEALANPEHDFAGFPVLGLPFLILMKMLSSRGRDFGDVITMLGWADDDILGKVRQIITKYSPQDKDDLESLIFLGQQERQLPDESS